MVKRNNASKSTPKRPTPRAVGGGGRMVKKRTKRK